MAHVHSPDTFNAKLSPTKPTSHSPTLAMERPEFVSVDNSFICTYCKKVLIEALQTPCGHRICDPCLEDLFKTSESAICPAKEDECLVLKRHEMCKDFSARRAILQLEIYCPNRKYGCQHTMLWKEFLNESSHVSSCTFQASKCPNSGCTFTGSEKQVEDHRNECTFNMEICSNCNRAILSRDESITEHLSKCLNTEMACHYASFGCDYVGINADLQIHSKESLDHHVSLLAIATQKLDVGFLNIVKDIKETGRENVRLETVFNEKFAKLASKMAVLDKYCETELENRKKFVNLSEMYIAQKLDFKNFKENIQRQVQNLGTKGTNQNVNTLVEQILEQTSMHDREIGVHDVRFAEIDTRFNSLEAQCYDGKFIWKITNFSTLRANAKSSKQLSIYSQPFYSSRFGYKMCGRVYPNGDGKGKDTHMSVFFVLMKGEFDNILSWPFQHQVTLTLLDQLTGKNQVVNNFLADPSSISFSKPVSEMNIATGCPCFIPLKQLENSVFLIDDTMFLQIHIT